MRQTETLGLNHCSDLCFLTIFWVLSSQSICIPDPLNQTHHREDFSPLPWGECHLQTVQSVLGMHQGGILTCHRRSWVPELAPWPAWPPATGRCVIPHVGCDSEIFATEAAKGVNFWQKRAMAGELTGFESDWAHHANEAELAKVVEKAWWSIDQRFSSSVGSSIQCRSDFDGWKQRMEEGLSK